MTTLTALCLMCGSTRLEILYQGVRDHYGIAAGTYTFLKCRVCGSATLSPRPAPAAITSLYPQNYTFKTSVAEGVSLSALLRALEWRVFYLPIYHHRLKLFRRLTGLGSGLILEVGCGSGLFLRYLAAAGYEVEGLEISSEDVTYAREYLALKVQKGDLQDATLADGRYDAVLLFSVLEHVPDPAETVREALRVLKGGGWILIEVPVIDSWQAKLLRRLWYAVTEAPRHFTIPSRRGVEHLLVSAGFSNIRSAPGSLLDNAGIIALSLLPSAAAAHSYGRESFLIPLLRRGFAATLLLPALFFALAERLSLAGDSTGTMIFCARKINHSP